ncbi:MAG TPA: FAD-dependent monooxygenase [Blastocatellia bacterium]|nr:FAD-dependent monooxygenase [Blastocatellia bacterium]
MDEFDVIVVGAGPAGCSAAITLTTLGARVLLLEEKRMPRPKLCGEFVTPECLPTLRRLGVLEAMIDAGAQRISKVRVVTASGRTVESKVPDISPTQEAAISLSRARFDQVLFERAAEIGVACMDGTAVKQRLSDGKRTIGVEAVSLPSGSAVRFRSAFVLDGSGRNSRLVVGQHERIGGLKGYRLYAMEAHLSGVPDLDDQLDLCFFPGGYGGLSRIEDGLVNICFILGEKVLRDARSDPKAILQRTMCANQTARDRLRTAEVEGAWLTVGPLTFGRTRLGGDGVIAIGDAGGMIDPFTGTGIQMALRTGELAAEAVSRSVGTEEAIGCYGELYRREFSDRLTAANWLRGIVSSPAAANFTVGVLSRVPWLARRVFKATRAGGGAEKTE